MPHNITITVGETKLKAQLNDSATARAIYDALPIEAGGNTWGDEIYFSIPIDREVENGVEVVEKGDLGYWPAGKGFCIFYGPTPASIGDEIRPASAVTPIGRVLDDVDFLKGSCSGVTVKIEKSP